MIHQQPFFEVLGKVEPTPVETAVVYTPPKKEAKPKAETPAAAPKKEAKPAKEEEDEEPAAEAPKAKHPCEALGKPASFPLDEWKRQYSNLETVDALKWLDSQYPAFTQDYSLWKVSYSASSLLVARSVLLSLHARLTLSSSRLQSTTTSSPRSSCRPTLSAVRPSRRRPQPPRRRLEADLALLALPRTRRSPRSS